jgi:hypothetical protein
VQDALREGRGLRPVSIEGREPPAWRSYVTSLAAGAVVVALAAVVSAVAGSWRPLRWTCAVIVIVVALLPLITVGLPSMGGEGTSRALSEKAGRDYFARATEGRYALLLHPLAFALPAIGTLLLMWAA